MFDGQAVKLEVVLRHRDRCCRAAGADEEFTESRSRDGPPRLYVGEHRLAEGQPRRVRQLLRRPFAVCTKHVRDHGSHLYMIHIVPGPPAFAIMRAYA
jgi:hypothetical protein